MTNGAQHLHDYVGNVSTDAFCTNESLAAAGTTCRNRADQSTYFWPVLRVRGANARPAWTCTGFTDRITDKYPICPSGSRLTRIFDQPSCWEGQNIDSANHRTHLTFPNDSGACPSGTQAVPQLRMTLVYNNVPNTRPNGTNVPFAVDGFASECHNPNTDHAGTIGVMSEQLMNNVVRCINSGRRC
ncbi:DUF1996 domain-containing protein [Nonomuraea sp. NPDC048901]|uniref:DUF1996 domain-containing protein n=1 Tax=Nonomuraea sp. NPDC048901 TaxID=3155627 RepID=UPI0033FD25F1